MELIDLDEKELWEKFANGGKIADYIEYRNCVNMKNERSEKSGENNSTGTCNPGTEYR